MRQVVLTAVIVFLWGIGTFAQTTNNLVVFIEEPKPFYAIVNGIKQNDEPQTNVKITGIASKNVSIKIIFNDDTPGLSKTVWYETMGREQIIRIIKKKKGYQLRYFGEIAIENTEENKSQSVIVYHTAEEVSPKEVEPAIQTVVVTEEVVTTTTTAESVPETEDVNLGINIGGLGINMNVNAGNIETSNTVSSNDAIESSVEQTVTEGVTTTTIVEPTFEEEAEDVNVGVNIGGVGINMNFNDVNIAETNSSSESSNLGYTTTTTTTVTSSTEGIPSSEDIKPKETEPTKTVYVNGYSGTVGCPIPERNIYTIKSTIEDESFPDDRMNVAKQATKNRCVTVSQVKELLTAFDFEDRKLEFAKYLYYRTYDQDNFYLVNKNFDFTSTKKELNNFLDSK